MAEEEDAQTQRQDQNQDADGDSQQMENAVSVLQKRYRGHRSKREKAGLNLETSAASKDKGKQPDQDQQQDQQQEGDQQQQENSPVKPNQRWNEALQSGGLSSASKEQAEGKNDAKSRWQRTGFYAERVAGTDGRQEPGNEQDGGDADAGAKAKAMAPNKQMEAQYWLEIVDSKHRYGTNLKSYHDAWNKSDTKQNFFYWLDHGEGKDLDLEACSRQQLDKERVMYLNAEQRKNYLVDVRSDGMLYWHRNGRKVDTAKGRWEDLGDGRGIGYKGEKDNLPPPSHENDGSTSSSSSASSLYSSSDSNENVEPNFKSKHYHQKPDDDEPKHKYWTSPRALMDVLLRKTINSNTWIYVCTTKGDLYVGIKATGGFQHSSFMYGATVASAGLLKAKDGQLTSLSPLSGHYRAGTVHFKAFCDTMQKKGVDMSAVSISKSLVVIGGIEKYGKFSKKKKSMKSRLREKLHLPKSKSDKAAEADQERNDKIEQEAKEKERSGQGSGGDDGEEEEEGEGAVEGDMHDGKRKEDLTEQERAERAIALIRSAFSKGLKGEKKQVEEAGGPNGASKQNGEAGEPSSGQQQEHSGSKQGNQTAGQEHTKGDQETGPGKQGSASSERVSTKGEQGNAEGFTGSSAKDANMRLVDRQNGV